MTEVFRSEPVGDFMKYEPVGARPPRAKHGARRSERRRNSFEHFAEDRPFSVGACTASLKVAASALGVTESEPVASHNPPRASAVHTPIPTRTNPKHVPQDVLHQCFPQGLPRDGAGTNVSYML